jgi:hypothetical protein
MKAECLEFLEERENEGANEESLIPSFHMKNTSLPAGFSSSCGSKGAKFSGG